MKMSRDKEYELTVLTLHLEKLVTDCLTQNQSRKPKQHNLSGILSTEKKRVYWEGQRGHKGEPSVALKSNYTAPGGHLPSV